MNFETVFISLQNLRMIQVFPSLLKKIINFRNLKKKIYIRQLIFIVYQIYYLPSAQLTPRHVLITAGLGKSLQAVPAGFFVPYQTHCNILYFTPSLSQGA